MNQKEWYRSKENVLMPRTVRGSFNMKKVLLVFGCIIALIALFIGLFLAWYYWIRPLVVYEFALEDCSDVLENFSGEENVGPITDAEDAREKGVAVLKNVFGEEKILSERPFTVGYDKNTNAWLVCGSMPPIPFMLGGVAKIIIDGTSGDVLAVWHEK